MGLYLYSMRTEYLYVRRILWSGKWKHPRYHCTEEHILFEHPEAIRLESTLRIRDVPETDEEMRAMGRVATPQWGGAVPRHADGAIKKMWER